MGIYYHCWLLQYHLCPEQCWSSPGLGCVFRPSSFRSGAASCRQRTHRCIASNHTSFSPTHPRVHTLQTTNAFVYPVAWTPNLRRQPVSIHQTCLTSAPELWRAVSAMQSGDRILTSNMKMNLLIWSRVVSTLEQVLVVPQPVACAWTQTQAQGYELSLVRSAFTSLYPQPRNLSSICQQHDANVSIVLVSTRHRAYISWNIGSLKRLFSLDNRHVQDMVSANHPDSIRRLNPLREWSVTGMGSGRSLAIGRTTASCPQRCVANGWFWWRAENPHRHESTERICVNPTYTLLFKPEYSRERL